MKLSYALAGVAAALLLAAAPAAADSIAYVKDDNIWLANPDGSGQVQITHDGTPASPYRSPSQADDGTIAAAHGPEIVKLAQSGQVQAHFPPPSAVDSTGQVVQDVPQQVAISPDGSRIAYVYSQPSCPPGAPCGVRQVMLYSYSDRTTPVAAFGEQTDLTNPSWIDNNRVLAFGGHFRQVNIDSPGGGNDDAVHWFDDAGNEDVGDGELSRQGDRLALVRSYGPGTHLAVYAVAGGVGGAAPEAACFTSTDASLAGPSWSPDGTKLAFQDSQGIEVLPLPGVVPGDCPGAGSSTVILPGASAPDWGPASIEPGAGAWTSASGAGAPAGGGAPGQSGRSPGAPSPSPRGRTTLFLAVPRELGLASISRRGITVRARASIAGRIVVRVSLGRRILGTARVTTTAAGTLTLRVRLRASAVRALRRRSHTTRLTIAVTLLGAEGSRTVSTTRVAIR